MPLTGAPGVASAAGAFNIGAPFAYTQPTPPQIVKQPTNPPLATLTDDFTTQDTAKWTFGSGTVVSGGTLQIPVTPGTGTAVTSNAAYSLVGSSVYIQVPQTPPLGNGTQESFFTLTMSTDATSWVRFATTGSTFLGQYQAGAKTIAASTPYDATAHKWWRFSESGGTVTWSTSPDGVTWTAFGTWAATFSLASLTVSLSADYYGTEPSPGSAIFDNVNVAPTAGSASASGAITLGGTVTAQASISAAETVTLSGTATATGTASATGGITLAGSGTATATGTGTGALTLGGTSTARAAATGAGTITLAGTAIPSATATATGTVTLAGTGTGTAAATNSGALTLTGTGAASVRATASGGITLAGTGTGTPPGNNASGSLTLGGTATAAATASATGGITLGGTATARVTASSSGSLTLAGAAQLSALANAAGTIDLAGLARGTQGGLPVVLTPVGFTARSLAGHVTVRGVTGSLAGRRLAGSVAGRTVQGHLQEVT